MSIENAAAALPMLRALAAGRAAGKADDPVTACPDDPESSDAQARARARMWLRGYAQSSAPPVDYSG
ncbi:Rmf/CrpP fold protein [Actinomadura terrae]|uniref:Rmf/CrpP fold protein n=1 Tax=Actinomadura terrae TaxID=604353 RepID=UPI001FA725F5|nr:Rmf/CrpP fold protein [Actinomadura terrae]